MKPQKEMIAYCGLVCSNCPTFLATQNDDEEARKKTAMYLDIRLELFGKPDSAMSYMAEATGGSVLPISFGVKYQF